jgi:ribosomal protein S18 acetylase RimI-like enzyme
VIGEPPEVRLRCNAAGMRAYLPATEQNGVLLASRLDGELAGVLVSAPPGAWPFPLPPWRARLACLWTQGLRVARRWAGVSEVLREHHPLLAHWYLATLGVEPRRWGRGVGHALLTDWLERVDAKGGRAYLETDAARNVSFYERAGFRVVEPLNVLGVTVWCMERPPHGGSPTGGS